MASSTVSSRLLLRSAWTPVFGVEGLLIGCRWYEDAVFSLYVYAQAWRSFAAPGEFGFL